MRSWSFPMGRILGVELRIHTFFVVLLGFSISFGIVATDNGGRGLLLWSILVLAVLLREAARAIAALCLGLELRGLLLLPTGGLPTYAAGAEPALSASLDIERRMAIIGPVASLAAGLAFAAIVLAVSPQVDLLARPWVSPAHLLRAFVWINLLLGLVNLLPAPPLDLGRVLRPALVQKHPPGSFANLLQTIPQVVAFGLILAGILSSNVLLVVFGFFVLLGGQIEDQGALQQEHVGTVTLRDVMLTDYTALSASDTLEDALERAIHSLQDVFPVVRGGTIVGAVSRQSILEALRSGGNSYVQGVMARTFEVGRPEDALLKTLRRIAASGGAQFVPVLEGQRVVGIVTPNHLSDSIRLRSHLPRSIRDRNAR